MSLLTSDAKRTLSLQRILLSIRLRGFPSSSLRRNRGRGRALCADLRAKRRHTVSRSVIDELSVSSSETYGNAWTDTEARSLAVCQETQETGAMRWIGADLWRALPSSPWRGSPVGKSFRGEPSLCQHHPRSAITANAFGKWDNCFG